MESDSESSNKVIVRGKLLATGWGSRGRLLPDAALYVVGDHIESVDSYSELRAAHPDCNVIGDGSHIVIPGFVNAHAHGRSSIATLMKGVPDEPLELRVVQNYLGYSETDPYWDVFASAIEQLEGGITTTLHLGVYYAGPAERYKEKVSREIRAYQDSGIRFAYGLGIRNQNNYAYEQDREFLKRLPNYVRESLQKWPKPTMTVAELFAMYDDLLPSYPKQYLQLSPTNPVWCSDELMLELRQEARSRNALVQIHLLETLYQKRYALKRYGESAVRHLARIGFLDTDVTCGHSVWLTEDDISVLRETSAKVTHNPSANLRMRSGISPVRALHESGVLVALGTDGMALSDDEDMFQETHLAQLLHSPPGVHAPPVTPEDALKWGTENGGKVVGDADLGRLERGSPADVLMIHQNWHDDVELDKEELASRILKRIRRHDIDIVLVGGQVMVTGGEYDSEKKREVLVNLKQTASQQGGGMDPSVPVCKEQVELIYGKAGWEIVGSPYYVVNSRD